MKLLFLNGSRGEWGYIKPIVDLCRERGVDYEICATNMLMLPAYGSLIDELRQQEYNVTDEIYMSLEGHNHYTMAKSLSVFMGSFVDVLVRIKPTWIVLAGDRGEQLMGAVSAAYTYTPIAHIQAGELSGNIDGVSRHAIGKFAHLHFAANEDAAERLKKLGEEDFRVHNVGHPALDEIVEGAITPAEEITKKYSIDVSKPYFLVVLHPTTEDFELVDDQVQALIDALDAFEQEKVWILSNNDAGSAKLRHIIKKNRKANVHTFENLTRTDYLGFMKNASCIVGNSSSGILEAPTFHLPAVNIGRRQRNRVQGQNVIDTTFAAGEIRSAIERALSSEFIDRLKDSGNPYGDGQSAQRILSTLENTPVDDKLLVKNLTY